MGEILSKRSRGGRISPFCLREEKEHESGLHFIMRCGGGEDDHVLNRTVTKVEAILSVYNCSSQHFCTNQFTPDISAKSHGTLSRIYVFRDWEMEFRPISALF